MSNFEDIAEAGSAFSAARQGLQLVADGLAGDCDDSGDSDCGAGDCTTGSAAPAPPRDAALDLPNIAAEARRGPGTPGLTRLTELALAARLRVERASGRVATKVEEQLAGLESIVDGPDSSGLSSQLDELWCACAAVADQPGAHPPRARVIDNAAAVATSLNLASTALADLVAALREDLLADVAAANAAARQLAETNKRFALLGAADPQRSELSNQRDVLLHLLAELIGATPTFNASGGADVTVAGHQLVSTASAGTLSVDASHRVRLLAEPVDLAGGSASASVAVLTGVLSRVQLQLDRVADALAASVNAVQAAGFDLDGAAGAPMYAGHGAAGISLVLTAPAGFAASATPGRNLDGANALALSAIGESPAGPNTAYVHLLDDVSVAITRARRQRRTHVAVVRNLDSLHGPTGEPTPTAGSGTVPPTSDSWLDATWRRPPDLAAAARLGHELARAEQYGRSAVDGLLWVAAADSAYARMLKLCRRAGLLARDAGAAGSAGRELREIRVALLELANTTYEDRPIFGGTTCSPIAYRADGSYAGDEGVVSRAVGADLVMQINCSGPQLFGDRAIGDDLFRVLADLADAPAIPSGERGAGQVAAIQAAIVRIANARSASRVSGKRLKAARTSESARAAALRSKLVRVRDGSEVVTTVSTADAGFRSALRTTAGIHQLALLDFLG